MTEKLSDANLPGEEAHIHCIAHCWKCSVDTLVEQQRLKCNLCSSPLVYYCAKCYESFLLPEDVMNHVRKQLEQVSISFKCSKCYRSDFTTCCSLIEHERNCNTPFCFDREIVVNLVRCNHQSELSEDLKPAMPLLLIETSQNQCEDGIKTEKNFSYIYDNLEVGEEFKQPFTISSYCQEQTVTASKEVTSGKLLQHKEDENKNIEVESQRTTEKLDLPQDLNKYKWKKICKKSLSQRSHLRSHSKTCEQSADVICCDNCNFKTNHKHHLTGHIQAKHLSNEPHAKNFSKKRAFKVCGESKGVISSLKLYSCDHCNYKTIQKAHLTDHIKAKHLPRDLNNCYNCDYCNHKTNYKRYLATHIQAKHLPRDPNANKCNKCNKSFSQRSSLKTHSKICGKSKCEIRSLRRYACDYCNFKTVYKGCHDRHIKAKHLPKDPNANKCNKCNKSFARNSNLVNHSKICGKSKDQIRSLSRFSCDHCDYRTAQKVNLANHITAKHLLKDSRGPCK